MEQTLSIINSLIPVFTLIIGAILTNWYDSKSSKRESALKHKESQYTELIIKLQGFVGLTANAKTKKEFFEERYKSWLYASDEVTQTINKMVELSEKIEEVTPDPEIGRKVIGDIVLAMRKDLNSKTKLKCDSFLYVDVIKNPAK